MLNNFFGTCYIKKTGFLPVMLKACYLLRFLGTTWTAESSFAAYFFILILMSDPVPANIALVSVLIFVSSSPSVNSSNKSLDLKNLLCFGSFKTLFVRSCLKICLQIKNYYMYSLFINTSPVANGE